MSKSNEAEVKFNSLLEKRISLLRELGVIQNKFNALADDVQNADEWIYELPNIKNISNPSLTKLGKVRERQSLKKEALKICKVLDELENEARIAHLDMLVKKIENAIE